MPFNKKTKIEALVRSGRRCCFCHVFAGRSAEIHHIIPESEGGPDTIDNAIVLCGRCHSEAGHYNPAHPIGNKYSPEELRKHRDLWWMCCERNATLSSPEDPVCVSPTKMCLADGVWNTVAEFMVSNRTRDPYWQVWIRLCLEPPALDVERLTVCLIERSAQVILAKHIGDLSLETLRIITEDESGRPLMFVMIDRLRPGEYLRFNVRLPATTKRDQEANLFVDLWSLAEQPLRWGHKDGQPSVDLPLPAPLRGRSSILMMGGFPLHAFYD
jgi:hypothetical protein